jgi:hypothetical protein
MPNDPLYCPARALVIDRENAHRAYWLVIAPQGHTESDIENPAYFGFHATKLKVGDVIEVTAEDLSWYGEWLVRAIPDGLNQVRTVSRFVTYFESDELPEGWSIRYLGGEGKHTIYRGDLALEGMFPTREEATIKLLSMAAREGALTPAQPVVERKKPGRKPADPGSPPAPPAT